jgi:prevent-host-death family protein
LSDSSRKHESKGRRRTQASAERVEKRHHIRAGEFKAVCLGLMDRVRERGEEYVITKHGKPVAKLAPITDTDLEPFVGRSRGVIQVSPAALLAPLEADWEPGADL